VAGQLPSAKAQLQLQNLVGWSEDLPAKPKKRRKKVKKMLRPSTSPLTGVEAEKVSDQQGLRKASSKGEKSNHRAEMQSDDSSPRVLSIDESLDLEQLDESPYQQS
jgi:hypothetical protein